MCCLLDFVFKLFVGPGGLTTGVVIGCQDVECFVWPQSEAVDEAASKAEGGVVTAVAADGRREGRGVGFGSAYRGKGVVVLRLLVRDFGLGR